MCILEVQLVFENKAFSVCSCCLIWSKLGDSDSQTVCLSRKVIFFRFGEKKIFRSCCTMLHTISACCWYLLTEHYSWGKCICKSQLWGSQRFAVTLRFRILHRINRIRSMLTLAKSWPNVGFQWGDKGCVFIAQISLDNSSKEACDLCAGMCNCARMRNGFVHQHNAFAWRSKYIL